MGSITNRLVTYEEWLSMPEVSEGIEEVVQGEVRIMPPNKESHANVVDNLADLFREKLDRRTVKVRATIFGLVVRAEPLTIRVPDLAIFVKKNMIEIDGYIHSAPELPVEVLSPGNTRSERADKLRDYEAVGVPEVWVISPEAQTVEVLQLENGRLRTKTILHEGTLAPKLFAEAAIEIHAIWEK